MRIATWLEGIRQDVRFALRQLRRAPSFTAVAALTLALGIGANSAIFALVDATLLRPLPIPDPDRVVLVLERTERAPRGPVSPLNMMDWDERSQAIDRFGAFTFGVGSMVMTGADGTAETVPRHWVSSGFFDTLGARPMVGRTFNADDERTRAQVVVLSEGFWRARFGADPSVVGRTVRLDGEPYGVLGVVPDEFQLLGRTSIWALISFDRNPDLRSSYGLLAIGRMHGGVSIESARADMEAVAGTLAAEYPATNSGRSVTLEPLHDVLIGQDVRLTSFLFLGVVGFVLLICCANVASLLLARATARRSELAIRVALGAGRRRVLGQLVTESLVLASLGGALGLGVAALLVRAAPGLVPQGLLPEAVAIAFDLRVVAFAVSTALTVGLLFGVVPAWQAIAQSSPLVISGGSRTTTGHGGRLRGLLVVAEVATAVVLLCGAGLLLRTLMAVEHVDRGYRAESVLTMMVDPLGSRYPTPAALRQFFADVERELSAVPGVHSAAWTTTLPLGASDGGQRYVEVVGEPPMSASDTPTVNQDIVSASYFATIDLPIVTGRPFDGRDSADGLPVCIVNEAFVRRHLPGRSPIGRRILLRTSLTGTPVEREVVGVAHQVRDRPDDVDERLQIYVPMSQVASGDIYLVVRPESGRAELLTAAVRQAIARVDREQLVSVRDVMTLGDVASAATSRHRFRAVIVATFAALALVLAMVGVFGILAYTVQQRMRDLALRRALGASTADVLRLVVGTAVRLVGTGAVIGLGLAALLGRLLTTVLFQVQPLDPLTFVVSAGAIVAAAAVAAAAPAWRAVRVDPAGVLRSA